MTGAEHRRALAILTPLLALAVTVSIVHYVDNVVAYEDFPTGDGPAPSRTVVAVAWFVFTAFGIAAYLRLRRGGDVRGVALLLALYSGSGLVGLGHYSAPGMTSEAWWRQAHVIADILCGAAILAFAAWLAGLRPRRRPAGPSGGA